MCDDSGWQLYGCYELSGVNLEGEGAACGRIAAALVTTVPGAMLAFGIPRARSPQPYDGFLATLTIADPVGPVEIYRGGDALIIRGDLERRAVLPENVRWFADRTVAQGHRTIGDHLHIEWYPGHTFLARDALPLVLSSGVDESR